MLALLQEAFGHEFVEYQEYSYFFQVNHSCITCINIIIFTPLTWSEHLLSLVHQSRDHIMLLYPRT